MSIDPMDFMGSGYNPAYFNRYAYSGNDPINNIDPDGQVFGKVIKFARNTIKHKGNPIKGAAETLSGIADDLGTLTDGQLNFADIQAVGSLITGLDAKDQKAIGGAAKAAKNALPKPPRGKGSVPKSERDPKRAFTKKEQQQMIDRQGGKCANGCGKDIDLSNSQGHHVKRHADGGRTNLDNGAQPCTECHKDLYSPD